MNEQIQKLCERLSAVTKEHLAAAEIFRASAARLNPDDGYSTAMLQLAVVEESKAQTIRAINSDLYALIKRE